MDPVKFQSKSNMFSLRFNFPYLHHDPVKDSLCFYWLIESSCMFAYTHFLDFINLMLSGKTCIDEIPYISREVYVDEISHWRQAYDYKHIQDISNNYTNICSWLSYSFLGNLGGDEMHLSVCPIVAKTLTKATSSEYWWYRIHNIYKWFLWQDLFSVLQFHHPVNLYLLWPLPLPFDLLQGQICCSCSRWLLCSNFVCSDLIVAMGISYSVYFFDAFQRWSQCRGQTSHKQRKPSTM